MISPKSHQSCCRSGNAADYDHLFVARVHLLLDVAYRNMAPSQYATAQETSITGDLVASVEDLLDYPTEDWMRFFSVHDDPPVNEPGSRGSKRRKGRARHRVDIRFGSAETSPRVRFCYECKRLGTGHSAAQYVGSTGLGCFLTGEYAAQDIRAGMLGYVQDGEETTWAMRLQTTMEKSPRKVGLRGPWEHIPLTVRPTHTYRSIHGRGRGRKPVVIYHTLLRFH